MQKNTQLQKNIHQYTPLALNRLRKCPVHLTVEDYGGFGTLIRKKPKTWLYVLFQDCFIHVKSPDPIASMIVQRTLSKGSCTKKPRGSSFWQSWERTRAKEGMGVKRVNKKKVKWEETEGNNHGQGEQQGCFVLNLPGWWIYSHSSIWGPLRAAGLPTATVNTRPNRSITESTDHFSTSFSVRYTVHRKHSNIHPFLHNKHISHIHRTKKFLLVFCRNSISKMT